MNEEFKNAALWTASGVCIVLLGTYLFGGGNLSSDGSTVDDVRADIQSAQAEADRAGSFIDIAEESNRDAQETADGIADSNEQLAGISDSIEQLINSGERILSEIRGRTEAGAGQA